MEDKLICITCPMGCRLTITRENGNFLVTGNKCSRGMAYALEELQNPKRVVSATCKTNRPLSIRVPCRTDSAFPKEKINDLLKELYSYTVILPVKAGDVLLSNVMNTKINIIATRTLK